MPIGIHGDDPLPESPVDRSDANVADWAGLDPSLTPPPAAGAVADAPGVPPSEAAERSGGTALPPVMGGGAGAEGPDVPGKPEAGV
jgi:hypothetical protein